MESDRMTIIVDGHDIRTDGGALDAATVIALAGGPDDAVVIRVDGGGASHFDPARPLDFDAGACLEFRIFPAGAVHHLRVDGRSWDWGAATIGEDDVRAIALTSDGASLHLEGADMPLAPGAVIDLAVAWPPRAEFRDCAPEPAPSPDRAQVPVVVNGRSMTLERPDVTFEDLVELAFPGSDPASPGNRSLTVTYRRGPPNRPEGSIVSRQAVRAQKGEVFNVTATDKA